MTREAHGLTLEHMTNTANLHRPREQRANGLGTALITLAVVAAILGVLAVIATSVVRPAFGDLDSALSNPTTSTGATP